MVFECFDVKCEYFFKVHVNSIKDPTVKIVNPAIVHRCVYPSFKEVQIIYPDLTKEEVGVTVTQILGILEKVVTIEGYVPFISPQRVKIITDEKDLKNILIEQLLWMY